MSRHRRRIAALVVAAALALGAGACGPAPAPDGAEATDAPGAEPTPGATSGPAATPEPSATASALFGAFRRSGVAVPPDVLGPAEALCRTKPVPPVAEEIGSRPLVVSDTRGLGVVLLVFADGAGATGCAVDVDEAGEMRASHFAVDASPDGPMERGAVTLGALQFVEDGATQRVIAVGRVGDGTTRVSAGFDDDTYVYSSKENGWYAMWWPGQIKPIAIAAVDNKNIVTDSLAP